MLPVVVGVPKTLNQIAVYSVITAGVSLLLVLSMGWIYFVAAVSLGAMLIAGAFSLRLSPHQAMRFFTATNVYLAGLFLAIAVDGLLL